METIRLVGGPKDGQDLAWRGGDFVQFVEVEPFREISTRPPESPSESVPYKPIVYRREAEDSNVFRYVVPEDGGKAG